jgi:hypothetical protein
MNSAPQAASSIAGFFDRVSAYLPTLFAGLLLVAAGVAVGWVAKRAVIRILIWLRLDRLGGRVGWRAALGRGDTRAALYNVAGSAVMLLVVLVFLDNALAVLGLVVLTRMLDGLVDYLPRLALAAVVAALGLALTRMAAEAVERTLEEEDFPRARLAGRICRGALVTLVAALTLWELDFARQIVLSGFLIAFGGISVAFALAVGLGSVEAIRRAWESFGEKRKGG